ncbi:hypothetical protein [Flavobacterium sp. UMI-01]|uniref:hypothetical protein n=1 Tax=Flavobacterium sp. UMI-01 TaxID=1441053 RepID=UPI001C7CAC52|nr:hypothetical protein [Flavobacterium sp. UMI-01]GIZ07897.1 hypothetical protein FUMI01_06240 [Flavobacterium sp. UMI-01]
MKKIIVAIIFHTICYSQNINGSYQSRFNSFNNPNDTTKNFFKPELNTIIIDVYDFPETNGSVTIMNKDQDGETLSLKYQITGSKRTEKADSGIYYFYPAKMYINNIPTRTQCTIAIHSNLDDIIILYTEAGTVAVFGIKN